MSKLRMTPARTAIILALAASMLAGAGCVLFVGKDDFEAYRTTRVARNERERMAALKRYASQHPDGHFIDRVREERVALEAAYWEAGQSSRSGLQLYLDMFPDGPHADEARPRFEALQGVASRGDDARAKQREIARQRLVQQAEERRTWLRRAAVYWLQTMLR